MNQRYVKGLEFMFVYLTGPDSQLYVFMHFSLCFCVVLTSGERCITGVIWNCTCVIYKNIFINIT